LAARDSKSKHSVQSLEAEVFLALLHTADSLLRSTEVALNAAGLSHTQYNVLRILRGAGSAGLPCGEIAARMITRDPDITRLLDRLEIRRLVARSREGSDRRVVRARITARGQGLLKTLDKPVADLHVKQLERVPRTHLRQLLTLLRELRGADAGPAGRL
jgi:DNA-binding MarR family transcriptional regulator